MSQSTPSVLLGVSGGIAAYKSAALASLLRKQGWDVTVALTQSATTFVTPLTFAGVSGRPVLTDDRAQTDSANAEDAYPHLYPATRGTHRRYVTTRNDV